MTVGVFIVPRSAWAVGTRSFELDSLEKLSGGDLKGVSVTSDGIVRAGWTLAHAAVPEASGMTLTSAIALRDGSVLVGTGPPSGGKVLRFIDDQASVFADTKESAVTGLAVDKTGRAYASTTSARIYRVSQGRADVFVALPDVDSVFALAADRAGNLYAATGSGGHVWRIDPSGAMSVYFTAEDPFVVSLAVTADGIVYAGTGTRGLLYAITGPGRATVVHDFPAEDVHAIALGPGGNLWVVVNESAGGTPPTESPDATAPTRHAIAGRTPAGPTTAPHSKPGKGTLWRFDRRGRPERLMHHDDTHYISLCLDDRGTPYVGTGAGGRVYTVDDAHVVSLVAATDERQVAALSLAGKTRLVLGSDPAALHRIISVGGPDAVWTSKPLDAGLRARFGRLTFAAAGAVEVSTRTGDTATPDASWSAWSARIASGEPIPSPPGRYLQVRARLGAPDATVTDIVIPFVTDNLRAIVTEITAHPKSGAHEAKEGVVASGSEAPKHDSVLHVAWKTDNPDSDELRFRVQYRRDGSPRWMDALPSDQVLTKPELDWDTTSLPEGKYRVRVDASDELANPPEDTHHHTLDSAPVLIDNTPPVLKVLVLRGRRLVAQVVDGVGPIARVEFAVDGRLEWYPLAPIDGVFDSADESVEVDVTSLVGPALGPHVVAVRAYDAAGNSVVREIDIP
ncbi:MAG: hypothetical protein ABTD50_02840 [Polyangiaceae bacterium]|jgi:hypothetical protein